MIAKSSLVTFVLSALTVSATPALELRVSGPSNVADIVNLKITTTIVNTGDETLKLLKDPRSVLDAFPAESFAIQHETNGVSPQFIGARLKYVPAMAIKVNDPSAFTIIKPSQSIAVTHDLSSVYDFTKSGTGKYTFIPSNTFLYVDPKTSKAVTIYARSAEAHQLSISGSLIPSSSSSGATPKLTMKRATYNNCTAEQGSDVDDAIKAAKAYAIEAANYTDANPEATPRYTTWFGNFTDERHNTVKMDFDTLNENDFSSYTYDCGCELKNVYAYVHPNQFGYVHLCPFFWKAPVNGTDTRGGTILHEASHFTKNAGTSDFAYGQDNCKELARDDPDSATMNADTLQYYAENDPALD